MAGPAETNGGSEWRIATFPHWSTRGKPEKNYEQTQKVIQSKHTRRDGGDGNAGEFGRRNGNVRGSKRRRYPLSSWRDLR
jgi:hypothetical protein